MPSQFLLFSLSWLMLASTSAFDRFVALPGCQSRCGNVIIPYPFGVGMNCSIAPWANIICNSTSNQPRPFIGPYEIVEIPLNEIRIKNSIATTCFDRGGRSILEVPSLINLTDTPYTFSSTKNKFTAIGCDTLALAQFDDGPRESGCLSLCYRKEDVRDGYCSGSGCCNSSIPRGSKNFFSLAGSLHNKTKVWPFNKCSFAFIAEEDSYTFKASDIANTSSFVDIPVVINFGIGNRTCREARQDPTTFACKGDSHCYDSVDGTGYLCRCNKGYKGNPYLPRGCQDVDECGNPLENPCEGICINTRGSYECTKKVKVLVLHIGSVCVQGFVLLALLVAGYWISKALVKRKYVRLKKKHFKRNGGLLLEQEISSRHCSVEKAKVFAIEELERATDHFNLNRIIGNGGFGTVYKGMLSDGKIVAVKKSKLVAESQTKQFINEVIILSQINHRNVVKLFGCCLETEVPLLVYEFISNGTLSEHLRCNESYLSWQSRVRISIEIAAALAYLHSSASMPIFHRDVKSSNILLDENYKAKVSDFGISRSVPLENTHLSTTVQGTFGYLDPEYFRLGQFTEKSDVYSFGVVLVELLTGKEPVFSTDSGFYKNLSMEFILSMKNDNLSQVLDSVVSNEGKKEEVKAVAELANKCLKAIGKMRPTMKEVASELEGLRTFQEQPRSSEILQQTVHLTDGGSSSSDLHWESDQDTFI